MRHGQAHGDGVMDRARNNASRAAVTFVFGPPVEPESRAAFDAWQEQWSSSTEASVRDWGDFEEQTLQSLIDPAGRGLLEEIIERTCARRVRIRDGFVAMGMHRGMRVGNLTIRAGDVSPEDGTGVAWPLPEAELQRVAGALQSIFQREWIGVQRMN